MTSPTSSPTNWGPASQATAVTGVAFVDDHVYTTSRFGPIVLAEYSLTRGQLTRSWRLPPESGLGAWGLTVSEGKAYVGAYSPGHLTEVDLDRGETRVVTADRAADAFLWSLACQGRSVVAGTYDRGAVARVDLDTGLVEDLAIPLAGAAYVRAVCTDGDGILACGGSPASLVRIDRQGQVLDLLPDALRHEAVSLAVACSLDHIAVGTDPSGLIAVISTRDGSSWVVDTGAQSVDGFCFDDDVLFVSTRPAGRILRLDLSRRDVSDLGTPVPTIEIRGMTLRDDGLWGVTASGHVWRIDPVTGERTSLATLAGAGHPLLAEPVQSVLHAHDTVHVGGHFQMVLHDPRTPGAIQVLPVAGEAKCMITVGPWVVIAIYPCADVWRYRTDSPGTTLERVAGIPDRQTRPLCMVSGGATTVLVGSQPALGELHGSLTMIDLETGAVRSYRGIIPRQSINAIALGPDGEVWIGSDIQCGLGLAPVEPSFHVARCDVDTGTLTWTATPVPGAGGCRSLHFVEGQLIGIATDGTLFALDPDDGTLLRSNRLQPNTSLEVVGTTLVAIDPNTISVVDPATMHLHSTVASDLAARWYTHPQAAPDESGRLWTLRGTDLVAIPFQG